MSYIYSWRWRGREIAIRLFFPASPAYHAHYINSLRPQTHMTFLIPSLYHIHIHHLSHPACQVFPNFSDASAGGSLGKKHIIIYINKKKGGSPLFPHLPPLIFHWLLLPNYLFSIFLPLTVPLESTVMCLRLALVSFASLLILFTESRNAVGASTQNLLKPMNSTVNSS